ncbi:type 1 glutamine amidotransferase domain-containing protein [Longimicrobium sp.]|uniref:type 1 glutamine amidotransferase domain-containing protein n=1 Tax=Longimicrobium sp. TaxID=2029185 RepID=UPI002E31FE0B|nr:type 1 glutamine amidotransferase domain-containing protein [Longimicrobium sp.]HEX6039884.1 type 1 glutamine amidotransferase domain-containing protein [Longimicrobium sp.]
MHHVDLTGFRVAVLTADGGEQVEITSPVDALREHGAEVEIVSLHLGKIRTVNMLYPGKKVRVDRTLRTADAVDYDALLLPGGLVGPDTLRQSDEALDFVRAFDVAGKPIAVICHGPWLLVSSGLVVRRNLTSWPGIKDDVRNAGGIWHDEPLVRDRNWVSSRGPQDLKHFNRGMLELFAERMPVAPPRPEYTERRPRRRRERNVPVGRLLAGTVLAAGAAYLIREQLRREHETMEYVEVVDLTPDTPDVVVDVAVVDEDATLSGTGYTSGMPYGAGAGTNAGLGASAGLAGTAGSMGGTGAMGGTGPDYVGTDVRAGNGGTGPVGYGGTGYNPPAV